MGKHDKIISNAIRKVQGKRLELGTIAAHPDDPITRELVAYEEGGTIAVLVYDGVTKRWPASEIFDVIEAKEVAVKMKIEKDLRAAMNAANNQMRIL